MSLERMRNAELCRENAELRERVEQLGVVINRYQREYDIDHWMKAVALECYAVRLARHLALLGKTHTEQFDDRRILADEAWEDADVLLLVHQERKVEKTPEGK